jgi:hypothetical protein
VDIIKADLNVGQKVSQDRMAEMLNLYSRRASTFIESCPSPPCSESQPRSPSVLTGSTVAGVNQHLRWGAATICCHVNLRAHFMALHCGVAVLRFPLSWDRDFVIKVRRGFTAVAKLK